METLDSVSKTVEERGKNYGSYEVGTQEFANIMDSLEAIFIDKNCRRPTTFEFLPLLYIVMKLIRLGATPSHIDSWHDIQGYAKLAEDLYKGKNNVA